MCQVMYDLTATTIGMDTVDDDPWTGWPLITSRGDGSGSGRRRILVPYNGTRTADRALQVAADWCELLAAEAWVLYVRPWDPVRGGRIFIETPADALAVAREGVSKLRELGVSTSAVVRDASRRGIAGTIVAEAEALGVSSIVMGTHARRTLGAALLGSTSMAVARRSHRAVILVKVPKQARRRTPPHTRPSGPPAPTVQHSDKQR